MNECNLESVINTIAARHRTTPEEVRAGIEEAIQTGMNHPDPKVRDLWKSMSSESDRPSADDAVLFLSSLAALLALNG